MNGRPAQKGAPVEGEAEDELRPVGEPLHERIEDDEPHRAGAQQHRVPVELKKNKKSEPELSGEKD